MIFHLEDRFSPPRDIVELHSTLPRQSVNVLHSRCSEENFLIRLLLGTTKLIHSPSQKLINQNINYSVLGCPQVRARKYQYIQDSLLAYQITADDLDRMLRRTLIQRDYYKELLSECCNFFFRTSRGEHTLAFLHLYRFLEHISFAFPVLYAARTSNFNDAYGSLKEYLGSGEKKELAFFKKFVKTAISSDLRNETARMDFEAVSDDFQSNIYTTIFDQISTEHITSSTIDSEIVIKNDGMLELCINMRNRYFHFTATNNKNISNAFIGDPDSLFNLINIPILNWLVVIYFETLKHRVNS